MIIGNGLIAQSLRDYDNQDTVFIAAGVSDSRCTIDEPFEREKSLVRSILKNERDKMIVYFSTFSINDPAMKDSRYVKNKLFLEQLISDTTDNFLIVRVSNLVGPGGNPNTVFNFFYNNIINRQKFSLWANAKRNLLMVDDFARVLNGVIENELEAVRSSKINIINSRSFTALEIVEAIEAQTGIKAIYELVEIESESPLQDEIASRRFDSLNINTHGYLERILNKYFLAPY